jgi:hypothetical protein
MGEVAASLAASSRVETTISPELMNGVSRAAATCSRCKDRAVSHMTEFNKLFASEANRVITDVSQRLLAVHFGINCIID